MPAVIVLRLSYCHTRARDDLFFHASFPGEHVSTAPYGNEELMQRNFTRISACDKAIKGLERALKDTVGAGDEWAEALSAPDTRLEVISAQGQPADECQRLMNMAGLFEHNNRLEDAAAQYQKVIETYPRSPAVEEASRRLEALAQKAAAGQE
ncbi:hypothetical protein ES703_118690 [subsurface metagenome]